MNFSQSPPGRPWPNSLHRPLPLLVTVNSMPAICRRSVQQLGVARANLGNNSCDVPGQCIAPQLHRLESALKLRETFWLSSCTQRFKNRRYQLFTSGKQKGGK